MPYAYAGKRYDSSSGLVYFGKRFYDPNLGRWQTPDPLGAVDHSNLFIGSNREKIKRISIDLSGMDAKLEFEEGYVFEIFTHSKVAPWKVYNQNELIFHAKVEDIES